MHRHTPFLAILAGYFFVAGLFAVNVPAWQAPDEPAHYNVVRQVAGRGCCPLIEAGDWDNALLERLKGRRFTPFVDGGGGGVNELHLLPTIQYEDHQPPLYYMLLAPVYAASGGSLTALRLASVVIGAGMVIAAYAVTLRAFHGRYGVAWTAAAFVAFLPQHVHILASVNNDALAWVLCGAILWASIDHADGGSTPAWALGLLVGVAMLTKTTAYMMAGVAFAAVWLAPQKDRKRLADHVGDIDFTEHGEYRPPWYATRYRTWTAVITGLRHMLLAAWYHVPTSRAQRLALFLVPALALGSLWWLRNIAVYGFPDFLGLGAHDEVVVGQLRTADYIARIGAGAYLRDAVGTTVTSFFGQFGWMAIPLHSFAVGAVGLAALLGVTVLGLIASIPAARRTPAARGTWLLFGLTALLAVGMLVYYNTSFVQFQGRYAYPLLIPLAVTVALGLDYLRQRLPVVCDHAWPTAALLSLVAVFDVYVLLRVIVPGLTP